MQRGKLQRGIALPKRVRSCTSTPAHHLRSLATLILSILCLPALALAAPIITSVTSSTTNGSYKAGAVIAVNVNFSQAVTVSGTPRLTLETGANDAVVSYSSGSGSSTLVFNYTVVSGHTSSDLDYVSQTALALNGGTINDSFGDPATLTLPTPATAGSLSANRDIRIDTTAPTITSVTSSTANGSYKAGAVIVVNVNFSEEVTVSGTPRLTLETGATDAVVSYSSGSGSSTLVFNYTVVSGHTTTDLDCISQAALALNGGSIQDLANNSANLTLPTPGATGSLGANSDIRIDTTAPNVSLSLLTPSVTNSLPIRIQVNFSEAVTGFTALDPTVTNGEVTGFSGSGASYTIDISAYANGNVTVSIPASSCFDSALNGNTASSSITARYDNQPPTITGVTASPTSGAYRATQQVTLLVNFSEAVTVTGIPSFTVETGASDGIANYVSGSGTTQLTFRYTVQTGHTSADLEYTATDAFVLNGGSIRDAATNDANLTLPALGGTGSLSLNANIIVDTTLPDVTITSPISGDTSLDAIPVVVTFSESVTGFTLSDFSVTNGCASNLRGSGTTYYADIVPRAHGAVIVSIPSAIAVDVAGNPNTAAPSPVNVNFFTFGPKVTTVTSSTPDGAYRAGQTISIQISFSDPVSVSGIPQLRLATGSIGTATYSSGAGTNILTFDYTIASGQNSSDLDYIPLPPLTLNGGTIRDLNTDSYDAAFTFACQGASGSLGASKNIIIDTIAPTVARITSTTANGAYRAGQTLNIRAQFSENVFVTGTPNITLETGPNDAVVSMASGSGSANLDFSYTIVDGHNSNRLDYTSTSALNPNGATIIDQAGNVADVTLPATGTANSLAGTKNLIVDTIPPTVPNVTSTTANGAYKAGSVINVQVAFSENIFVTLTPRIALAAGMPNRYANYSSGSGTNTLNFSYTVAAGDTTADLDYASVTALETNGGTIRDQAGNDSIVNLATPGAQYSLSFNKNIQLDTTAPTILSVASSVANGFYSVGATIPITVSFSEAVNVVGIPTLALNTTPVQGNATYLSGTGTSTLTFVYTVAAGNNSVNLDYISTSALTLPAGATIRDPATNSAVLTLSSPGAAGSLGAQGTRVIDTTVPTLSDISFATPNGIYRAGQELFIDLTFSEVVALNGSLKLQLATNSSQGVATCANVLSPTSLRCSYTIIAGDNSGDLDYQSTTSLSFGSVSSSLVDLAGNSADLTLPTAGGPLSLAGKSAVIVDTTPPSATLTSSSQNTTNLNPIPVTITFSEAVTGLELTDFNVTNSTVQNLSGSGFSYTAQLVPQTQGIVQVNLKNNSVLDLAGNTNSASLTLQRTYDSVRPSVALTSTASDPTNASTIPVTITFSESVTGFTTSGITVTNGSVTSLTGSGTTYTAQIAPSSDGVVTILIPDNVGFDAGNNGNTQSLPLSRTYDSTLPVVTTVTATTPNGYYPEGAEIAIQVVWSEPVVVTGTPRLALAVSANPVLASYVSGSGSSVTTFSYTVAAGHNSQDLDYTSTTALQLIGASIKDNANNAAVITLPNPGGVNSLAGQRDIVIDTVAPTAALSSTAQSVTNQTPIPVVILFSEAVSDLTVEDFAVINGTLQNLTGSGSSYTAELVPQAQGVAQIQLKAGSVFDLAGNTNSASLTLQRTYDSVRPSVALTSTASDPTNASTIPVTITFSESVTGFTTSGITVTNGSVTSLTGSGTTYTAQIAPSSDGVVTILIPDNVGFDAGNNGNTQSLPLSRTYDSTLPVVTTVTATTPNGYYPEGAEIAIQVVWSEPVVVTGTPRLALAVSANPVLASYVSGSGSSVTTFSYTVAAGHNSQDLDYTSTTALQLIGATIKDNANNAAVIALPNPGSVNSLAGQRDIVIDTIAPTATLSSSVQSVTNQNPIPVVITFSEAVSDLTVEDFSVVNGMLQNLTGSGSSYSAELLPQAQGITQISLKTTSVTDSAGNTNQSSASLQRIYDSLRPSVRIYSSSADTSNTNMIPATIVFSEAVDQFTSNDITITNGTISSFSGSGDTYSIEIIPSTDGAVELFIPQNVAFDSGGNGNLSSDTLSRFFDSTPPRIVSVTSTSSNGYYREGSTISIQVVCSEPVYVTGSPRLALDLGSGATWATYSGGSESNTLTFSYTVAAGNNSPDLDYPDIAALQLDGGTIKDLATNSAAAILPQPGSPDSLAGQKDIVIDTIAPAKPTIAEPITGSIVKRAHVEIKGTAEANASIEIKDAKGAILCSATSSESRTWSCMVSDLDDGAYQITSKAEDRAGNRSASSDSISFTVDLLALDSPTFLEPENGGSTDPRPTFSGIAPANKKVRVRRGGSTLCVADVTAAGSWSCQSAEALSPGRYEITGTTEDPGDLTTSSATPLALVVGARLTGIVLLANRDLTPLEGVEIKDQNLAFTTSANGTFSLITPDLAEPKITLRKFGWRIERSATLSDRARQSQATTQWLATPTLESEVYTIWGGGNAELRQQLRVLNRSGASGQSQVSLFGSDGNLCAKVVSSDIIPNATEVINLSQENCLTRGGYGLARVTFSQPNYDGSLITSGKSLGGDRWLSSYSELPLSNTVTGKSYAPFDNSYRLTRKDSERLIRRNDLIVSNPNTNPMSFTVKRYSSRGSLIRSLSFSVPALGSFQVPFDEQAERLALNGVEEIEPNDPTSRYLAVMLRSGSLAGESKNPTSIFIQSNYSDSGFGQTFFTRVRDVARRYAVQYLEITNISPKQANVRIKRIDTKGRTRPTIPLLLQPLQTRRIRLSRILERYEEGVAEITSDVKSSLLMNSVIKHYRSYNTLASMKSSSIQESYGDLTYGSYDVSRGTQTILKVSNLSSTTNSGTISCYSKSTLLDSIELTLRPGELKEINLRKCFGRSSSGVIELNSATPGTLVADLIRFKDSEDISLRERMR